MNIIYRNAIMLALALAAFSVHSEFPSAKIAWIIPGGHQAATDQDFQPKFPTPESVESWELQNADLIVGSEKGSANGPETMGYMYNQKLDFSPTSLEMYLRQRVEASGESYESLFLHFAEDTELLIENDSHGTDTPFARKPSIAGWTESPDHYGYLIYDHPPYDKPVWEHSATGGGLYVYLFERFDRLQLDLSASAGEGRLIVEYPSATASGMISNWRSLDVIDGTNNLKVNGEIRWTPPADWQRAATHDGSANRNGGPAFAKSILLNQGRMYVVRLRWEGQSGSVPRLADVKIKDWMPMTYAIPASAIKHKGFQARSDMVNVRRIPGWDPDNDKDGNGYLDDSEYSNLANPFATARFEWESRVRPLGRMWGTRSAWSRPNLGNKKLGVFLADFYRQQWQQNNLSGAYNDDLFKLLKNEFYPISGGKVRELQLPVHSDQAQSIYIKQFISTLETIRLNTNALTGANISMVNLWSKTGGAGAFLPSFSVFVREGLIRPSLGFSGWFGLSKAWDTFALSYMNRISVLAAQVNWGGRVQRLGNTQVNWEKDIEASLAQFYLLNVPGKTFFHMWNQTWKYGSSNTTLANYHTSGIPKNVAYLPTGLLSADLGNPTPYLPAGKEPIAYMARTTTDDYAIVGYANQTELVSPLFPTGSQKLIPSNIFYLQRSAEEVVPGGPKEMIMARDYEKGLVLFRTEFYGQREEFVSSSSGSVHLPGWYRRVGYDGSLGEPINTITLFGYEGAILVKVQ